MIILHRGERRLGLRNNGERAARRTVVGYGKRALGRRDGREAFLRFENTAAAIHGVGRFI
jgi:hypothetical protein